MRKKQGHYCRICGQHKANEKFSGKGHATHVCKACSKRGNKPPDIPADIPFIENEEEFFSAYDFPLDVIPDFDFEDMTFQDIIDNDSPKKKKPQKKKKIPP